MAIEILQLLPDEIALAWELSECSECHPRELAALIEPLGSEAAMPTR